MKTLRLNANDQNDIELAGNLLKQGKLVAVPTETVYGLAADASNPTAVSNIFKAKGRPANHPLITHISDINHLEYWATDISPVAYRLAEAFWPGPLTILFNKHHQVSGVITGGLSTIGIRIPKQPQLLKLLASSQIAVAAPSANPYQKLSPTTAQQVVAGLDGNIDAILDAGRCAVGLESTIIRIDEQQCTILRSGPISAIELQPYFNQPILQPVHHLESVSGNKKVHYQPNVPVRLFNNKNFVAPSSSKNIGLLHYSSVSNLMHCDITKIIKLSNVKSEYAREFYRALYELEQASVSEIWVERPPEIPEWFDVIDRLSRAQTL
ncbi:MAG: threonylcarbamoyl-AMP synthase [Gammaproteobacteria bacterium]|nr:threonylcarbamoyl-AMP synthase [Gammaproteobacteria bacterium]